MRIFWIIGGIFFTIGVALLIVGGAVLHENSTFAAHAAKAQGEVTALTWHASSDSQNGNTQGYYYPTVEFQAADGRRIQIISTSGSNPAAYARGETVTVLYDPVHPGHATIDSFGERWVGPIILGGLGTVFSLIGGTLLAIALRRKKVRAWLAQHGTRVQAKFEDIDLDTSLEVNGRNPWVITAQWQHPTTRKIYVFESDSIWFDPTDYVQRETVDVIVNINNPKEYVMDISFLPEMG